MRIKNEKLKNEYELQSYFNEDQKDRIPIEKAYGFEPVPKELTLKQAKHILGGQANLWTEHIASPSIAEEMLYPN